MASNPRLARLREKTRTLMQQEYEDTINRIEQRPDYTSALDPFLQTLKLTLSLPSFLEAVSEKVILTLCKQAPPELFHAAGCRPFKLACGSYTAGNMAPGHLPALTCPMIKSLSGFLNAEPPGKRDPLGCVIPTTCDWVTRFNELTDIHEKADILFLDLPRLREDEQADQRWLGEIKRFKSWLEKTTGQPISARRLLNSVRTYNRAYGLFTRLVELRRNQQVPVIHFALIMNAMPYQDIEIWMEQTSAYILDRPKPGMEKPPVFLTGSPIVFPNLKLLQLIENAGMAIVADDLCTLERSFSGPLPYEDPSEYALLKALSQKHHKACTCPTSADNHRRFNTMTGTLAQTRIKGIIFHVLKGCHPFDMESGIIEKQLKQKGYRFLKIETDYVKEDEQTLVTRLDAFRQTLRSKT